MSDTATFIEALTGSADTPMNWQTYDDKKQDETLTTTIYGPLSEVEPHLLMLNELGAGIHVGINETPPGDRTQRSVTRIRALAVDFDGPRASNLPEFPDPSIIVESVRGRHMYWVLSSVMPPAEYLEAQLRLAAYLGADASVSGNGPQRCMRVPGFDHHKSAPMPVHLVLVSAYRYHHEAILEPCGSRAAPAPPPAKPRNHKHKPFQGSTQVRDAQAWLAKRDPAVEGQHGDDHTYKTVCHILDMVTSESEAFALLQEWNRRCAPPWSDKDLRKKIRSALKSRQKPVGVRAAGLEAARIATPPPAPRSMLAQEIEAATAQIPAAPRLVDASTITPVVIDPKAPYETATQMIAELWTHEGMPTLRYWHDEWYRWVVTHYRLVPQQELDHQCYEYLRASHYRTEEDHLIRYKPTSTALGKIQHAIAAQQGRTDHQDPAWLTNPRSHVPISMRNGLLELQAPKLSQHTPEFFCTSSLDFDYDPAAACPQWLTFLSQLWPNDPESIQTLQDIAGYLLTDDNRQQKIFLIVGPKRCGKGTIGRIFRRLIGLDATCAPKLAQLENRFAAFGLLGKRLAVVGDCRISAKVDAQAIAEILLSISGGDPQTVEAKYEKRSQTVILPTRFLLLSNETPTIADASSALAGRYIPLRITQSFFGNEDIHLESRLTDELPGILNWAIQGLQRLTERGRFYIPGAAQRVTDELVESSSPISQFVEDACDLGYEFTCDRSTLFKAWKEWCGDEGRDRVGIIDTFAKALYSAFPDITAEKYKANGSQYRRFRGIRLK